MISVKDLTEAGYKFYDYKNNPGMVVLYPGAEGLYQKKIKRPGVLYFINAYHYIFPNHDRFHIETHLYMPEALVIQLNSLDFPDLFDLEIRIQAIYNLLDCVPDPHND